MSGFLECFLQILRCIFCVEDDDRRDYRYYSSGISRDYSSSSSYSTPGVTGRTNRDYWNSGTVNSISCGSVKTSPVNRPTVNSVGKSPVNPPTVTQTLLRLPPTPPSHKVTQKPLPSSPSVHWKKPVDSAFNGKSTITTEQETIKRSPEKGDEGTRTRNNVAPASPAVFSKNSSGAFLSSNKPVISSSGPPQSPSKPLLSYSGSLSSASKTTPASLKEPLSSRGPHPSASEPTLFRSPSPIQNGPISVVVKQETIKSSPEKGTQTFLGYQVQRVKTELPRVPGSVTSTKPPSSIKQCQSSSESSASISKLSPSSLLGPQNTAKKKKYVVADKDIASIYVIPDGIKDLIKKDIVPEVLRKPLSPSTYRDYFAALLYAEDFYIEKWSNFCLTYVNLELHKASIYKKLNRSKNLSESDEHDDKMLVAFQIDLIPESRPFLLSRDFVFVRISGESSKNVEPFQGILYRVVKSTLVLAEFGDDFYSQHAANRKYDISFSFNRVCLKRSHQAVAAAMDSLFQSFLFPSQIDRVNNTALSSFSSSHQNLCQDQTLAITQISRLTGPSPFLIEGPLCITSGKQLSKTGLVIREAVLKIYRTSPRCRILINAPTNSTCDLLLRSLTKGIPESEMFRANAAFRELDGVPYDILPSCEYKGECFTCPSLLELSNFKVILSTFVSSFRIHKEGIHPGHFSHIFLVDASSATEPETMVTLSNLVNEKTSVVVTGALGNSSGWVRSDIARRYGLKKSYFQRLLESKPYKNFDGTFVMHLGNSHP